jgi:hypothetical protein
MIHNKLNLKAVAMQVNKKSQLYEYEFINHFLFFQKIQTNGKQKNFNAWYFYLIQCL